MHRLLIDAVDRVGADARVWTFLGPRPAGWWIRRRLHEVTVHRADAALALGGEFDLPPELAADAVSEWIDLVASRKSAPAPLDRGQKLHLHAAETALGPTGEWTIVHDDDGVWWSHNHEKGDVAVRGPVTGLLLALTRRRTAADARRRRPGRRRRVGPVAGAHAVLSGVVLQRRRGGVVSPA